MSKSNTSETERKAQKARSELDALLSKAVDADQRANKPAAAPAPASATRLAPTAVVAPGPARTPRTAKPVEHLERLTVRFTQAEAVLLEKARGVARTMGFKVSDTAVFRLALNALRPETMSTESLRSVLAADSRRKRG